MDTSLSVWLEVTEPWGANTAACVAVHKHLLTAYSAKNRYYHDLKHIEHMLAVANQVVDQVQDISTLYIAIWFHDCIQKIGRDSEQLSADFAEDKLTELKAPVALVNRVVALIMSTKHGDDSNINRDLNPDQKLISDIDLCILGSTRAEYQLYTQECRKEYPVTDFIYKRGRNKFLTKMVEGGRIFLTDYFTNQYEERALENIKYELGNN